MAQTPPSAPVPTTSRADLIVLGAELLLVAAAVIVGAILNAHGVPIHASAAPLLAVWLPHIGPGTALAIAVAALVIGRGFEVARAASWRPLLLVSYVAAVAWTFGLALVDGWSRGVAGRLATTDEYLHDVPRVTNVHRMLSTFTDHILNIRPDFWTTHVAGHPPGAFLVFIGLDRVGLGGGAAAGVVCILVGAVAPVCVAVTLRALGSESAARAALPFLVLFPGAVWVGSSADGLFMGVAAAGLALIAGAGWIRNLAGGALLGYTLYLSYGLVLIGAIAVAVLWLKANLGEKLQPGLPKLAKVDFVALAVGVGAVVVAFTVAGFWWVDGYHLVIERYHHGYGGTRPQSYWIWANLACLVIAAGPAVGPALARIRPPLWASAPMLLPLAAAVAIAAADLSGFSKAETERIWLPFAIWLLVATALLPERHRRRWLALQAVTALLVNHLLLTHW